MTLRPEVPVEVEPIGEARWARIERETFARLDDRRPSPAIVRPRFSRARVLTGAGLALAAAATAAVALRLGAAGRAVDHVQLVTTESASQFTVGESSLTVAPHSLITVFGGDERGIDVVLDHGTITCEVSPRRGRPPFLVNAGEARVRVTGTRFTVVRDEGATSVDVDHGTVEVTARGTVTTLHDGDRWPPSVFGAGAVPGRAPSFEPGPGPASSFEPVPVGAAPSGVTGEAQPSAAAPSSLGPSSEGPDAPSALGRGASGREGVPGSSNARPGAPAVGAGALPGSASPGANASPGSASVSPNAAAATTAPPSSASAPSFPQGASAPAGAASSPSPQQMFESAAALERAKPDAAAAAYGVLAEGSTPWAPNALFALARLEADRGRAAEADRLLRAYLSRFPRGINADDARALLARPR